MHTINKIVTLIQKPGVTPFQHVNRQVIGDTNIRLGRYMAGTAIMTDNVDMNLLLLRKVLGVNPESHNVNWDDIVKTWWANVNVTVPSSTLRLQVGLSYSLTDSARSRWITEIKRKIGETATDESFGEYVEKYVDVTERWKYGTPIDALNYLQYQFALIHREVANNISDMDKSTNIRCYMYTEEDAKRKSKDEATLHLEVAEMLQTVAKDAKRTINVLRVFNTLDLEDPITISTNDDDNKLALTVFAMRNPAVFKGIVKDKDLTHKAFIAELFTNGLIERMIGSDAIVLSTDKNIILGSSTEDVLNYFVDAKNTEIKNTLIKQNSVKNNDSTRATS